MARRTAAQKRAFSKMLSGLRKYRRAHGVRRKAGRGRRVARVSVRRRKVTGATARRRYRNPLAVLANPAWVPALYGGDSAARKPRTRTRKRRKGTTIMAKKRRKSGKRRARKSHARRAPVRRRRRAHARRRSTGRRRVSRRRAGGGGFARVRRGTRVIYINPRKKHRHRRSRRRNPGFSGMLRRTFTPYAVGFVTSGAVAVLDAALASHPNIAQAAKIGGALLIAKMGGRHPVAATAAIAAIAATQGYAMGTKLAGGFIAHTPAQAVKGLGDMTQTYPEMGALLNGGVGALLNGMGDPGNIDSTVSNYETALNNMSGDDD